VTHYPGTYQIKEDENGFGPVLVLGSQTNIEINILMKELGVRAIRLSESMGWNGTDLSVLASVSSDSIDSLEIYSSKIADLSGISKLSSLKKIGLQTKKLRGFRVSDFPYLEVFFCKLQRQVSLEGLSDNLRILKLTGFLGEDLSDLPSVQSLQYLAVYGKRLKSLSGIERYPSLLRLTVGDAESLSNILAIRFLYGLQELKIHRATHLLSLAALSESCSIRSLELDRCGEIESLAPLVGLSALEELVIEESMSVRDGNLAVLADLPRLKRLVMAPRRGYSPSLKEIREELAKRT
jgi:hypothetical protein